MATEIAGPDRAAMIGVLAAGEDKAFVYEPLPSDSCIRLLHIHSLCDGVLERSLTSIPSSQIDSVKGYFALSYCWGVDISRERIKLNGQHVIVTLNLYAALKAAYEWMAGGDRRGTAIWADALCIDQGNGAEKSKQVMRMHEIYRGAARVLVWLGEGTRGREMAMRFFEGVKLLLMLWAHHRGEELLDEQTLDTYKERLTAVIIAVQKTYHICSDRIAAFARLFRRMPDASRASRDLDREVITAFARNTAQGQQPLLPPHHSLWKDVDALLDRPWYKRVWTYQEIVLATQATLIAGNQCIEWSMLTSVIRLVTSPASYRILQLPSPSGNNLGTLPLMLPAFYDGQFEANLETTLRAMALRSTSDPRDYVYGGLGLLPEATRSRLAVDYRLSTAEVFTNTMRLLCREEGALSWTRLLRVSMDPQHSRGLHGLPSWCPDLSEQDYIYRLRMLTSIDSEHAQDVLDARVPSCSFSPDGSCLIVRGRQLDMIKASSFEAIETFGNKNRISGVEEVLRDVSAWLANAAAHKWSRSILELMKAGDGDPAQSKLRAWLHHYFFKDSGTSEEQQMTAFADLRANGERAEQFANGTYDWQECVNGELIVALCRAYGAFFFVTEKGRVGAAARPIHRGNRIVYHGGSSLFVL